MRCGAMRRGLMARVGGWEMETRLMMEFFPDRPEAGQRIQPLSVGVWARKKQTGVPDDGLAWSVEPDAPHANGGCGLRETRRDRVFVAGWWWCEVRAK